MLYHLLVLLYSYRKFPRVDFVIIHHKFLKSVSSLFPFALLQVKHSAWRFDISLAPPLLLGIIWSTSRLLIFLSTPHNSHLPFALFNTSYLKLPGTALLENFRCSQILSPLFWIYSSIFWSHSFFSSSISSLDNESKSSNIYF